MEYKYQAIRFIQTSSEKSLVFFSAPATEIDMWSGVPQKKKFGDDENAPETTGFQRVENFKRIENIKSFFNNENNIVQNPLLCALRSIPNASVNFIPLDYDNCEQGNVSPECEFGYLAIKIPDYSAFSLIEIMEVIKKSIEERVPDLKTSEPSANLVASLKRLAVESGEIIIENNNEYIQNDTENDEDGDDVSSVLFEESHIIDFWNEIAARHKILEEYQDELDNEKFLGFTKDSLVALIKPVVLVDGQHRLGGALLAAKDKLNELNVRDEIQQRVISGEDASAIDSDLASRNVRNLPVSLLMTESPAEQVFQFVIVNQKATPVGKALLGTIVSTTLSNDELDGVADRLKNSGIELEQSQAITFFARSKESPFYDLIERGLSGNTKDLLQWNVFSNLVTIFRDLKGGKLYIGKNDYAALWRSKYLNGSNIVDNYSDLGYNTAYDYWRKMDGPWREIFICFWNEVRDRLGNTDDPDSYNYWGRPRTSNLFNKVTLTILSADFFKYLVERGISIDTKSQISNIVESWLENVNSGYFNKDWKLSGVKKDSTGIRKQWSYLWTEYRISGGPLPDRRLFSSPKGD